MDDHIGFDFLEDGKQTSDVFGGLLAGQGFDCCAGCVGEGGDVSFVIVHVVGGGTTVACCGEVEDRDGCCVAGEEQEVDDVVAEESTTADDEDGAEIGSGRGFWCHCWGFEDGREGWSG